MGNLGAAAASGAGTNAKMSVEKNMKPRLMSHLLLATRPADVGQSHFLIDHTCHLLLALMTEEHDAHG
jgi:hypothetical protein